MEKPGRNYILNVFSGKWTKTTIDWDKAIQSERFVLRDGNIFDLHKNDYVTDVLTALNLSNDCAVKMFKYYQCLIITIKKHLNGYAGSKELFEGQVKSNQSIIDTFEEMVS